MARGWESKSVELQREDLETRPLLPKSKISPETADRQRKLDCMSLSRTRILHDLQTACNPRYRGQLEAALAHVEGEIAKLSA
jgi:hypothetical protein